MISKSVFRYCKISFYSPNIGIVLFYGKYTNIDIDAQYQEIYADIPVLSVFFSIIMKSFKNIFLPFIQILKMIFRFVYLLKRTTPCLFIVVIDLYWKGMACHACLLFLIIIITYKNAISCSSHDSTASSCQTWSLTKCFFVCFRNIET